MQLYNRLKKIAVAVLVLFLIGACTEGFEELNTDPRLVTDSKVQPAALFTSVLKGSIFDSFGAVNSHTGQLAGYHSAFDQGSPFNTANRGTPFNWYRYVGNLNDILRLTAGDPQKTDQRAMVRIWKVWIYHIMTDIYGDIPYSEAALGVEDAINQPKYDTQESIYIDMLNELKEAAVQLGSQGDQLSFGDADILYQGDTDMWKRFANSLRLRLAMRTRFADQSLAETHINEVINAPLITENSQNASLWTLPPSASEDNSNVNFWYNRLETTVNPLIIGFTIVDVLLANDDPRLPLFAAPSEEGTFRGRPIQLAEEQKNPFYTFENVSLIGPLLTAETYEIIILNAAEVFFLRAEAAHAGITGEDKEAMYIAGIQKSMDQYGIAEANVTAFLNEDGVSLSGTDEEQFEKIITQKFISIFQQSYEAYAEYRRTGYPTIWFGDEEGVTDHIPRRYTYITDEYLKNEVNLTEAIDRQGPDTYETRIWWDARPGLPIDHPLQGTFPPN